jgi:hypothetical protein
MPTPSDAARNPLLENISVAAFQAPGDFIARQWFPTIPSETQTGRFYEIDTNSIGKNKAGARAPGAEADEGQWDLAQREFGTSQFGYREKIPEELIQETGAAAKADVVSQMAVDEVMLINEEVRIAAAAFKTGVWARDMAGAGSNVTDVSYIYWSTASTSKPVKNVLDERLRQKRIGKRWANTMIIGAEVEPILLEHADIIGRLNNGQTPGGAAQATLADLAKLFKVDRVLVAGAVYNTDLDPTTPNNQFILNSKSVWLGYVNPTPAVRMPSAGYRFTWAGIAGNDMGVRSWKYWDQAKRSFYVEGAVDDAFKIVSTNNGTFFDNIIE